MREIEKIGIKCRKEDDSRVDFNKYDSSIGFYFNVSILFIYVYVCT